MKASGPQYLIGIDEAGRGPLAGPVAVGIVALNVQHPTRLPDGQVSSILAFFPNNKIRDSKRLSAKQRQEVFWRMEVARTAGQLNFLVTLVSNKTIDRKGISYAINFGLQNGLEKFNYAPALCRVLLDGNLRAPEIYFNQETLIKGDEKEPVIALASIAAKVIRDRWLVALAKKYPNYGLERHKGYGTRAHYAALRQFGLTPIHRQSFLRGFESGK